MDKFQYRLHLEMAFTIARLVRTLKLKELLEAMNRAESVGPILDPTLYAGASTTLQQQKDIISGMAVLQRRIEDVVSEMKQDGESSGG